MKYRDVMKVVSKIDRRKLTNNTQKVLWDLLHATTEWVSSSSIKVPSATSRLRDLRKPEFGGFEVECASSSVLERKKHKRISNYRQTYYRLVPDSVTLNRVNQVFKGVVATV